MMQENVVSTTEVYLTRENIPKHYIQKGLKGIEGIKFHYGIRRGADKSGKLGRWYWYIFTAGRMQIWAMGIVDGREVSREASITGIFNRSTD